MVAQLSTPLKPKKLRVGKIRLNSLNAMRAEARIVKREFEKTTATWKNVKPTFEFLISLKGDDATILVGAGGNPEGARKWQWLNDGTKKNYPIVAKNAPFLVFRDGRGFTAKTKVKSFSSGPGANVGAIVRKKRVIHSGIKARDWTGEIAKLRRKPFTKAMIKATKVQ